MKPTHISISGTEYPVVFNTQYMHRRDCGVVIVNEKPIATLDYAYGEITQDAKKRLETAVQSFHDNEGKWSLLPNLYYSYFSSVEDKGEIPTDFYPDQLKNKFDISLISEPTTHIDIYDHNNTPHLLVFTDIDGQDEVKFLIWEPSLMREVAIAYNARQTLPHRKLTQESAAMHHILRDIL